MESALLPMTQYRYHYRPVPTLTTAAASSSFTSFSKKFKRRQLFSVRRYKIGMLRPITASPAALPEKGESHVASKEEDDDEDEEGARMIDEAHGISSGKEYSNIIWSSLVGVLTGIAVVLFNNAVHEIRDFFWDGIPYRGASWLREEPLDSIWLRVICVPACGGLIVSILNQLRTTLPHPIISPFLKSAAACFTLGTGNSLGPEGPSVEIGASIAKGLASLPLFRQDSQAKISLLAAGSAAGLSSGFNAAVAGCFFAVESVLWPSPGNSSMSLTNTTSMVILSAVIASVVSEVGLGSEPAFKVPEYDFRSPSELPLYLLLGILCGLVSLTLSRSTSFLLSTVNNLHEAFGIPRAVFPVLGGLTIGLIALAYPEILYWGFENVDILLESRPFVQGLSANLLLQLVGVKIVATSLCRASGLVGGYYAPSLFIGAATGMAYGKLIGSFAAHSYPAFQFSIFEVASPQAYGLVGMAATLAGVCQVPLTSVLLLFELTQDYRIVIPLLGAVGLSSWITSGFMSRDLKETTKGNGGKASPAQQLGISSGQSPGYALVEKEPYENNLCEVESSLCLDDSSIKTSVLKERISVSEAMRTRYVAILMGTLLTDAVTLMLAEKQSCALIVDDENILIGFLTLGDIEDFSKSSKLESKTHKEVLVSEMCSLHGKKCQVPWAAKPGMDLLSAQLVMDRQGLNQIPVISEHIEDHKKHPVGLLDRQCIDVTCRALATRESLR